MFDFEFDFCASWDVRCRRDYSSQTSSNLAIVDSLSLLDLTSSAELKRILMDLADQERGQPDPSHDLPPDHRYCHHAQTVLWKRKSNLGLDWNEAGFILVNLSALLL